MYEKRAESQWRFGLDCEVLVNGMQFEHVSEFKYLEHALDESGTDETSVVLRW